MTSGTLLSILFGRWHRACVARCENAEFTGAVGAARRSAVSQRRADTMTATAARGMSRGDVGVLGRHRGGRGGKS